MKENLCLFTQQDTNPETEGVKYAGSKLKLIPLILELTRKADPTTVLDAFSGTTRVSQAFAQSGYSVTSNDVSCWSKTFATCYLLSTESDSYYQNLIDHLNTVKPVEGWFTEHYGGLNHDGSAIQSDGLKKPWQRHNTAKLDGIREEIERLNLNETDKSVALTSLILALDKVDNTLGHFASYLKQWSARSYNALHLKVPKLVRTNLQHSVLQKDAFDVASETSCDLAYLDPPYGSNNEKMPPSRVRYAAYYHLWTSVCRFDKPELFGKVKRRADTSDKMVNSPFEDFRRDVEGRFIAVKAIERLIREVGSRWVILSYSSGGRATAEELHHVLVSQGKLVDVVELDYAKNVMANMSWTNEWLRDVEKPHREFLFLLDKG